MPKFYLRKCLLLIFVLLQLVYQRASGQLVSRSASFGVTGNDQPLQLSVGGYLDGDNTKQMVTYWMYNMCKYYLKAFEPATSITLTNNGNTTVSGLSLVLNDRKNWYSLATTSNEVFRGTTGAKEKALAVYNFVKDNHVYFYTPDINHEEENLATTKFLGIYGFGHCGNIANAVAHLTAYNTNLSQYYWLINGGEHGVADLTINDTTMMIDADEAGYYLKLDNSSLASFREMRHDMYLYYRTKHFGALYPFYPDVFENFANVMMAGKNVPLPMDTLGSAGPDIFFALRPGESIQYLPSLKADSAQFHQIVTSTYGAYPSTADVKNVIGNGLFCLQTDFTNTPLAGIADALQNLTVDTGAAAPVALHAQQPGGGSFILEGTSPYTIVNASIKAGFYNKTAADRITIYYSEDKSDWTEVWQSSRTGKYTDSLSLYDLIAPLSKKAVYQYYLKFEFSPALNAEDCGLDSLELRTRFQMSEFFMPALLKGNNRMLVKSENANNYNLGLKVDWNESFYNRPPNPPAAPVFPANGQNVDSTYFQFKWQRSSDPDDYVADYQFQLSDRPDMKNALSPIFDRFMSSINVGMPFFRPELQGFLNDNTRYYWRVRAIDSRGTLSDWSPVWSFVAHGVTVPKSTRFELSGNDTTIHMVWNSTITGRPPVDYKIYASNEEDGFVPKDDVNFWQHSAINNVEMPVAPDNSYYRVIAVDNNTNESAPGHYIRWPDSLHITFNDSIAGADLIDTAMYDRSKCFFVYDTSALFFDNDTFNPRKAGTSIISYCIAQGIDTVYLRQTLLRVDPVLPEIGLTVGNAPGVAQYTISLQSDGGAPLAEAGLYWAIDAETLLDSTGSNKIRITTPGVTDSLQLPDFDVPFFIGAYALNTAGTAYSKKLPVLITPFRRQVNISSVVDTAIYNQGNSGLLYDTTILRLDRGAFRPLKEGITTISQYTVNGTDTQFVKQVVLIIRPPIEATLVVSGTDAGSIAYKMNVFTTGRDRDMQFGLCWSTDSIPDLANGSSRVVRLSPATQSGILPQSIVDSAATLSAYVIFRGDTVYSSVIAVIEHSYGTEVDNYKFSLDTTYPDETGMLLYDSEYVSVDPDSSMNFKSTGYSVLSHVVVNGTDTVYLEQSILRIVPTLPEISLTANDLHAGNVEYIVQVLSDGGAPLQEIGVAWSDDPDFQAINGQMAIDRLHPTGVLNHPTGNASYYIRAYAVNEVGTSYSDIHAVTANDEIQVYPNPTSGQVKISAGPGWENFTLEIFNTMGQLVQSLRSLNGYKVIDLSHLSKGTYFLRFVNPPRTSIGKTLIIQ